MKYQIKEGQSVYDLALLFGYGLEGVIEFIQDTPEIESLNDIYLGGRVIEVTKKNDKLGNYLSLYATGISSVPQNDKWILSTGKWNNEGKWDNNKYWIN
jgi:hypothetical protein